MVEGVEEKINECYGTTEKVESKRAIHADVMDKISEHLVKRLRLFELPLTPIFENFDRSHEPYKGCRNVSRIGPARTINECCREEGNHNGEQDKRPGASRAIMKSKINFPQKWDLERAR